MTRETRSTVVAASIPFTGAAGFLLLVQLQYGTKALLLACQDLGFGLFQLLLLPTSVAGAWRALTLSGWKKIPKRSRRGWALALAGLLLGVVLLSWRDARRAPSPPYVRAGTSEVSQVHELRAQVIGARDHAKVADLRRKDFEALRSTRGFSSATDFTQNASVLGWYALVLNILGFCYAAALFLYLVFRVIHPLARTAAFTERLNNLVLAIAALTLWFPLRVFSEWFNNFYDLDLTKFEALLPILLALLSSIVLLARIAKPETFEKWWKIVTTALGLVAGLTALWNPKMLFVIAAFAFNLDLLTWAFSAVVGAIALFGLARAIASLP